jgi:hypothetical protein
VVCRALRLSDVDPPEMLMRMPLLLIVLVALPSLASAQGARGFAGRWELTSDDGTSQEIVELEAAGDRVRGTITALTRGYFSGRTTVQWVLRVAGVQQGSVLRLRMWDPEGSEADAASATAALRGEYLVLRGPNGSESGYARPGAPLVRDASGSAEAAALAAAVRGRVYALGSQASGRGGAMAGGRVRLALCADGSAAYDASDVATTGAGGDIGSSTSRRGGWDLVLLAGAPAVRARWQGTGTSYSLTRYFRVVPEAGGATVDGVRLPLAGRC